MHRLCRTSYNNSTYQPRLQDANTRPLQRIQKTADEQFADEQMGFRRKVRTRDQVFNIRILMEKAREFNVPL